MIRGFQLKETYQVWLIVLATCILLPGSICAETESSLAVADPDDKNSLLGAKDETDGESHLREATGDGHLKLPSKLPVGTSAQVGEYLFTPQTQHVHSSSMVECPDGSLLAAWFQGSGERKADDVKIMGARKLKGASHWSQPFLMADNPGHPDCNPVLWIDQENKLWLFWSTILSNEWSSSLIKYRTSTDYLQPHQSPRWEWQDTLHIKPVGLSQSLLGQWRKLYGSIFYLPRVLKAELSVTTWPKLIQRKWKVLILGLFIAWIPIGFQRWRSKRTGKRGPRQLVASAAICYSGLAFLVAVGAIGYFAIISQNKIDQRLGWLTANQPVQFENGQIVLPLYSDKYVASIMAITKDGGKTWQTSSPIIGYGAIQPSLVERKNGQLVAFMRENGPRKCIRTSCSEDRGVTWSEVRETSLPNPGSKVCVLKLENDTWVMAYNPLLKGRHLFQLAISHDEGASWQAFRQLEQMAPHQGAFSYPCLQETSDGNIHVTYSCVQSISRTSKAIKHVRIDRALREELVALPGSRRESVH